MDEWIHVTNFDDHGAFLQDDASAPAPQRSDRRQSRAGSDASRLSVGVSSSSSSSFSSLLNNEELPGHDRSVPPPPSFEAFLSVPPAFLAASVVRSATECATLFDIAQLAMEMDVVLELVLDQLQDRHTIQSTLAMLAQRSGATAASLETTLVVLQRQAQDLNAENLVASLTRMQQCLNELDEIRRATC
ncbi:hypothetical protein ATCC90586_006465 [Pythium insidiosum]|nr:hypothetical protein ATCC90586_006465 [Pythium insidiosum]